MTEQAPTRGHKKKERTRRQLITAAIDVVAERGEAFSVSDVSAAAEVSNGTFYNYFNDRQELIDAIIPEVLSSFADASAAAVIDEDPARRFATITALALVRGADEADSIRVVLRLDAAQRAIAGGEQLSHLMDDLADGVAAGRFSVEPDEAVTDVIAGSLLMALRRQIDRITSDPHGDADPYRRTIVTQLLRSLGLSGDEATELAEQAVATAHRLHGGDAHPELRSGE